MASPLGFTEAGRHYYREMYLPALTEVVAPVDPWAGVTGAQAQTGPGSQSKRGTLLSIGRRNIAEIRTCALLAAYLEGQEVDSGTAAEIGFAMGIGVTCFGLRSDLRQSGEAATSVNLQVEAFVVESGGCISDNLEGLIAELARATKGSG